MSIIFEVQDTSGRKIYLPERTWSHITKKHPYISSYVEKMKETVKNPDKITFLSLDKEVRYCYKYYKKFKKYVLVIVKYLNGKGHIITAHFVKTIQ